MLKQLMYALTSNNRATLNSGSHLHPGDPGRGAVGGGGGGGTLTLGDTRRGTAIPGNADGLGGGAGHYLGHGGHPRRSTTFAECREFAFVGKREQMSD